MEFKEKVEAAKKKVKEATDAAIQKTVQVGYWVVDHKEEVIGTLTAVAGVGAVADRLVGRRIRAANVRHEEQLKRLYVYDRRNGHYVHLRRPLKASEQLSLDQRRRNGESVTEILNSMRLAR